MFRLPKIAGSYISIMDLSTTTPLWCQDLSSSTTCYFPSEQYLYYLDASHTIQFIFLAIITFFLVAIFIKKLFEKI